MSCTVAFYVDTAQSIGMMYIVFVTVPLSNHSITVTHIHMQCKVKNLANSIHSQHYCQVGLINAPVNLYLIVRD